MKDNITFIQYLIPDFNSQDLKIEFCGYHKCEKSHAFGPAVRDCYLVHFCISGKGYFTNALGNHTVKTGEFFVIKPEEITTYIADKDDPWEYVWIAFSGKEAKIFNENVSTMQIDKNEILEIKNLVENNTTNPLAFKSIIYKVMLLVSNESFSSTDTIAKIKQYIKFNYMDDLSLNRLSKIFGYERTYLYRIFKKNTGSGIKEYVTKIRMNKAKSFLEKGYTVVDTACIVGYTDPFNFSKAYKNYFGHSPKAKK